MLRSYHDGDSMGLDEFPTRGSSGIYDGDGSSRVPKSIRDDKGWVKGQDLEWVSQPDEDFVRVYEGSEVPTDTEQ